MLYAANTSAGTIDVFNSSFDPVDLGDLGNHAFRTPGQIEARGLVPFNVTDIGGDVYVTYAPSGRAAQTMAGEGDGAVAIFSESGKLEPHGVLLGGPHTPLAAPWGVVIAPDNFGQFSGDLLVGNFSFQHSEINAFDPQTHQFRRHDPDLRRFGKHAGRSLDPDFRGRRQRRQPEHPLLHRRHRRRDAWSVRRNRERAANWGIDADASFRHVVGLIDAAWPFRWHDAAHTPRQLMSRRKKLGRPRTEWQAATCAITRRGQTPARRGRLTLERPVLGTTLGRLHLCGRINRTINRGPLGGHRVGLTVSASLPLFPQERRYSGYHGPSPIGIKWCPWPESNQHSLRNSILVERVYQFRHRGLPRPPLRATARSGRNIAGGLPGSTRAEVNVGRLDTAGPAG